MSSKQNLLLSIFTFITVLAWIALDVYHAAVTSTITPIQQKLMTPLDPKLDTATIKILKERKETILPPKSPLPTASPTPIATSSAK